MFKKVVLSLLAAVLIFGGTAFAVQGNPNVVNGMLPDATGNSADSAFVNPGGLGDTLIYPYYNVRGQQTFFNIVNTDETNKVVARVRFREAKQSREVLDFNLCLTAGDVWTAVITDDGSRGRLSVMERHTPGTVTNPVIPSGGVAFKDASVGGIAGVTADDTREGYFEIIGLITVPEDTTNFVCPASTTGVEANDVNNSLFGAAYMVNASTGETFGYNATAIGNFHIQGISTVGLGTENITLASGFSFADLNFSLTKANLYGFYVLDADIAGESAYVVSFPTKSRSEAAVTGVFDRDSATTCPTGLNNVIIGLSVWDDAEHVTEEAPQFSPISTTTNELCYEVNVIELASNTSAGRSNILNSNVEIDVSTGAFDRGFINLSLTEEENHFTSTEDAFYTSFGVPAIGLQLHSFGNGRASGMMPMSYRTVVNGDAL